MTSAKVRPGNLKELRGSGWVSKSVKQEIRDNFLRLLRDWGPYRAGTYAFVSPIIAVGVGMALAGERYTLLEFFGAALMLAAVGMSLRPARANVRT